MHSCCFTNGPNPFLSFLLPFPIWAPSTLIHRSIRVHTATSISMRFRLYTQKRSKTLVSAKYPHATNKSTCDISVIDFILMRFYCFRPSTLMRCECVFDLIHFQEYFQIDTFSMKTLSAVVWTEGITHRKVWVFKRKPISGRGLRITTNDIQAIEDIFRVCIRSLI